VEIPSWSSAEQGPVESFAPPRPGGLRLPGALRSGFDPVYHVSMVPVLEAVPNFSEGRDLGWIKELVQVIAAEGPEVIDWTTDRDHHRSVVNYIGDPESVEAASIAAARFAIEGIDLRTHEGVHPRIGALDVLPFVPLHELTMDSAVESAWRVGSQLAEEGVPVFFYGEALRGRSSPRSDRSLASIRRGGFEALRGGFPEGREPDLPALQWPGRPHPTAGATCVGARKVMLAWNVFVEGASLDALQLIARGLRESGGGFKHLRAMALALPEGKRLQISMNLEDPEATSPYDVFDAIEERVEAVGGRVIETEVIGMIPDPLVLPAAKDRFRLLNPVKSRLLSRRVSEYVSTRGISQTRV
jgi:glutamate formiminotransferase